MKSFLSKLIAGAGAFAVLLGIILAVWRTPDKARAALRNNFLVSHILAEREKVKNKAKIITLNHFVPRSYDDLGAFLEDAKNAENISPEKYIEYYERVVQYMPQRADAHGMLGFCYYYAGEYDEAISSYEKAVNLNPHIFVFHYNLGVIYFKKGYYKEANASLKKALLTQPGHTLLFIRSSKIYQDIIRETSGFNYSIQEQIKAGYRDCRLLFGLSQYYLKNPPGMPPGEVKGKEIGLRVF